MQMFPWMPLRPGRFRLRKRSPLGPREASCFRMHLLSAVAGGISMGVVINHEYIAVNGLGASPWQVTALTMIWPVSNFLSCLLYTSPSPRDRTRSRMPSSA